MTRAAILRDGLLIGRYVTIVVTAETPWGIRVSEIFWIGTPGHFQIRKHVALINPGQHPAGDLNIVGTPRPDIAILALIESVQPGWNSLRGLFLAGVIGFQQFHPDLFNKRQRSGDPP